MQATSGFVFIDGDPVALCSKTNLDLMMTAATFSNTLWTDFLSTERPVFIGGSEPTNPSLGQCWWLADPGNLASNPTGIMLVYDGSKFTPLFEGVYGLANGTNNYVYGDVVRLTITNSSGSIQLEDQVVAQGQASAVIAQSIQAGDYGFAITHGFCRIRSITGTPVNWGALLPDLGAGLNSATASSQLVVKGSFGRLVDKTNNLAYVCSLMKIT